MLQVLAGQNAEVPDWFVKGSAGQKTKVLNLATS
jgi:hypothetical protein